MVKLQLQTGKTVMITLEKYLSLTDEDIQNMIADDKGKFIDNPFKDYYVPGYLEYEEPESHIDDRIPIDEIENIKKEFDKNE